jgi:hypothetical protein
MVSCFSLRGPVFSESPTLLQIALLNGIWQARMVFVFIAISCLKNWVDLRYLMRTIYPNFVPRKISNEINALGH